MIYISDASFHSFFIVLAAMLLAPLFLFATFIFSGASPKTGMWQAVGVVLFGALMFWVCIEGVVDRLGILGNLIVPSAWILPSMLLIFYRRQVLKLPLSQHFLVGLQIVRIIGGVFLIEMTRGNVPTVFAIPAGLGDILVGIVAAAVLWRYQAEKVIPARAVYLVIGLGIADFVSALFFGFTSSESPVQLFFPNSPSQLIWFPTGIIPLFLVPYAIYFHTLSALNYQMHDRPKEWKANKAVDSTRHSA